MRALGRIRFEEDDLRANFFRRSQRLDKRVARLDRYEDGPIVVVSFCEFNGYTLVPGFSFENFVVLFRGAAFRATYLNTLKFAGIVWAVLLSKSS